MSDPAVDASPRIAASSAFAVTTISGNGDCNGITWIGRNESTWRAPHSIQAANGSGDVKTKLEPSVVSTIAEPPAVAPTPEPTPVAAANVAAAETPSPTPEPAASPDAPAELDPKAAKKEKLASQVALERGKNDAAIEAGERSVKLDPTDGEAWLILGAAYQAKGKAIDARRCFTACLKEGKRGPKGECAAMLR